MDPETQPENEFNRRQRQLMINLDRKAFYATGQDHMKIEDTSKSTRREKIQRKKSKLSRSKKKTKKEKLEDRSFSSLLPMRQQTRPRHGDAMRLSDGTGDIFAKEWVFSTNASPPPVRAWVDYKRGVNAEGNGVNLFFQDYEDSEALCDLDEVRDFSEGVSLEELRSGAGAAGSHRAAWLDSRVLSNQAAGNMVKEYPNPLTPTALYKYLSRNLISDQRANRVLM
jgi:hypothetical protein